MRQQAVKATVKEFRQLEEGELAQLVNGEIIMTPSPSFKHQKVSSMIFLQLINHVRAKKSGTVLYAPMDVYFDQENVFQPDILYISNERSAIIKDDGIHGAPDLVIEIVSLGSGYHDTKIKKRIYEKYGVKEYWIVDPMDLEVTGFINEGEKFTCIFNGQKQFTVRLFDLQVTID